MLVYRVCSCKFVDCFVHATLLSQFTNMKPIFQTTMVFLYMHMHFCHLSKIESIFLKQNNIRSKAFDIYSNILKISQYKEHLNCLKFRFTFFQLTFFSNRKKTPRTPRLGAIHIWNGGSQKWCDLLNQTKSILGLDIDNIFVNTLKSTICTRNAAHGMHWLGKRK